MGKATDITHQHMRQRMRMENMGSSDSRRWNRRQIGGLIVLDLALAGTFACAHDASVPETEYHATDVAELHAIVDQLRQGAAPEQAARLHALEAAAHAELERLGREAIAAHHRKVDLLLADAIDRHALAKAQANEQHAAAALATRIDQALVDVAKTLTPAQRAQFRAHNRPHAD